MKFRIYHLFVTVLLLLAICSCGTQPSVAVAESEVDEVCACVNLASYLIGKTQDEVDLFLPKCCIWRVVSIDGVPQPITKDLRPGRINLSIVGGKVTSYEIESKQSLDCTVPIKPLPITITMTGKVCECIRLAKSIVGMTESAADKFLTENGCLHRVVERDGVSLPVTLDFRPGRINIRVRDGKVVSYGIEAETMVNCSTPEPTIKPMNVCECIQIAKQIIGMSEAQADKFLSAYSCVHRIVERDGVSLPITKDLRPGRINIKVKDGKVISYEIEAGNMLNCSTPPPVTPNPTKPPMSICDCVRLAKVLVGMTETQAVNILSAFQSCLYRIVERDGKPLVVTDDFIPGRINIKIANGIVISYSIEGESDLPCPTTSPQPTKPPMKPCDCVQLAKQIIGMTEAEADKLLTNAGCLHRTVERDGKPLPITKDYRPGRINIRVSNGKVISYEIEGESDLNCPTTTPQPTSPPKDPCDCVQLAKQIIGMTEAEADKYLSGCLHRVVERDGKPLIITMDLRPGRINIKVKDGKIIGYDIEMEESLNCQKLICECIRLAKSIIGMTEAQSLQFLKSKGCTGRVVERDGKPLIVTADYVVGRVNIKVANGKVIGYSIEGESDINCPTTTPQPTKPPMKPCDCVQIAKQIIGMTEAEADKLLTNAGCLHRIVERDGKSLPITEDLRPGRINIKVAKGKIIGYDIEMEDELNCQQTICECIRLAKSIIGMTEAQSLQFLKSKGCIGRVVERDGKSLPVTADYVIGRINIKVAKGKVIGYSIEGQSDINCLTTTPQPTKPPMNPCDCIQLAKQIIGMTEAEADKYLSGCLHRVVERDGKPLPITLDLRPGRINIKVAKGKIIGYDIEDENELNCQQSICECIRLAKSIIGMTEAQSLKFLKSKGCVGRIVERDGKSLPVTADYVIGRINIKVAKGKVIGYSIEGQSDINCPTTTPHPTKPPMKPCDCVQIAKQIIGMTESKALELLKSKGCIARVVERDGKSLPTTDDYVFGRINIKVTRGRVISYEIEGESNLNCPTKTPQPTNPPMNPCDCIQLAKQIIGMNEADADKYLSGCLHRVVERDGKSLPITFDYRPGRINIKVAKGYVIGYEIEGESDLNCATTTPHPTKPPMKPCDCVQLAKQIIGMTEAEADKLLNIAGCLHRTVERDGKPLPVTFDYRPGRINIKVANGRVIGYDIEGESDLNCPTTTPQPTKPSMKPCDCVQLAKKIIGMTEAEADKLLTNAGCIHRTVERDGKPLPTTRDYIPGRINIRTANGKVISYEIEGQSDLNCPTTTPQPTDPPIKPCDCVQFAKQIIGMTEADADKYLSGCVHRVVERDGKPLPITLDLRPGRINIKVANGFIIGYDIEMEAELNCQQSICECLRLARSIIGMTENESQQLLKSHGCVNRIIERNGQEIPGTPDYIIGRISIRIANDRVSSYVVEGESEIHCP